MILILGGAWQGKLTWAASHGMVGPVFDLKDGWPEAPVRCCRHLEALTRAASDRGETAQQVLDRLLPLTRDAFVISREIGSGVVPVTVLDEIFRQAQDSLIAHNARFINEGKTTLYYGEDFAFHKAESQEETAGIIRELYQEQIAAKGIEQVEILSPFRSEGEASVNSLNEAIREEINPAAPETPEIVYAGKIFRLNDRVMQMRNNYEIKLYNRSGKQVGEGVFNGDIGTIRKISGTNVVIEFDGRYMDCPQVLLDDLELSYAITIHKSMGSEYDTVIIPLLAAHNVLLTRNLLYTAITRAKCRVLLVGEKRALYMAIHRSRKGKRNTMLGERIALYYKAVTRKALRNEEGEEWQRAS